MGRNWKLRIDPALTPLENAQRYFEKYDKAKRARAGVPELVEATEQELDYLKQLEIDLQLATNWPEIGEVQDALQRNGYWRGTRTAQPGGGKSGPLKVTLGSGMWSWVGRNARQNDTVTFDKGGPTDLWLHAHGLPGAHVIIKSGAGDVPEDVIRRAAEIAAYYSGARNESARVGGRDAAQIRAQDQRRQAGHGDVSQRVAGRGHARAGVEGLNRRAR